MPYAFFCQVDNWLGSRLLRNVFDDLPTALAGGGEKQCNNRESGFLLTNLKTITTSSVLPPVLRQPDFCKTTTDARSYVVPSLEAHRKINTQILGQPNPETKGKEIFLEHILRPIQKLVSSLPGHFSIRVKMTTKNTFFYPWFLG